MDLFWPRGRSKAVVSCDGEHGAEHPVPELSVGRGLGRSWRDKSSSEDLGSNILGKEGHEPESFPKAALPWCSEQLELLKMRLLQEKNTQTFLFEGCGNVREKLRKKSKNLFGVTRPCSLAVCHVGPCHIWAFWGLNPTPAMAAWIESG